MVLIPVSQKSGETAMRIVTLPTPRRARLSVLLELSLAGALHYSGSALGATEQQSGEQRHQAGTCARR